MCAQGEPRLTAPPPLCAGRLIVELCSEVCTLCALFYPVLAQRRRTSGNCNQNLPPCVTQAPKAVENFRCLCTGERGKGKKSGKRLHYQDTPFHRIVKRFVCQGGDIVKGDGSGGDSIYGGSFKQEKAALKLKHAAAGVRILPNASGKIVTSSNDCHADCRSTHTGLHSCRLSAWPAQTKASSSSR